MYVHTAKKQYATALVQSRTESYFVFYALILTLVTYSNILTLQMLTEPQEKTPGESKFPSIYFQAFLQCHVNNSIFV